MRHHALFAAVILGALAAGCASPTATPEPTPTPVPTATASATATRPAPTVPPTNTAPAMPTDPEAFANHIIDNYSEFEGTPLGVTGEHFWLQGFDNHLILKVSKGFLGNAPYNDLDVVRDESRVERWAAPLVRDMETYAAGKPWAVWYSYDYIEEDAVLAGRTMVTLKDWISIDTDYDAAKGGFSATQYPIRLARTDIVNKGSVKLQFSPFTVERMATYYQRYLR